MLIKVDVNSDLYQKIENLIKEGKYQDILQFIKISISNQLQEEIAKDGTPAKYQELESPEEIMEKIFLHELELEQELEELRSGLSTLAIEKSNMQKDNEPFIWNFYNRFFPVKIAIFQLANLISPKDPWVNLDEWQASAVSIAQNWYRYLKENEIKKELKTNEKLTIGLPTHSYELGKVHRKREKSKLEKKIASSKSRFMDQFVGRYNKKKETFDGACFRMGLISAKRTGNSSFVSLTDLGKEFALLENPIIHEKKMSHAFSNEEVKLIYKKIIPQFNEEKQIIEHVITELKKKSMTSNDIQKIFEKYKKSIFEYYPIDTKKLSEKQRIKKKEDKITQTKVATMGRLSELKIVDWETRDKMSRYSLNQEKAKILGL